MTTRPAPYERALSGRDRLRSRFEESYERLRRSGRGNALRSFRAVLSRGRAAINMPVQTLVQFLREGEYLNVYELVARDKKLVGGDLEQAVLERLRELGPLRRKIDQIFHFQPDTHYASFNVGGEGAHRYGRCCVILDLRHWAPFHTCFAGDSIRACFQKNKSLALSEEEILAKFAIGEDLDPLAVIHWATSLEEPKQVHCFHPAEVREIVEAEDSMLEIHLHGPVTRDQILEVLISRKDYSELRGLALKIKSLSPPLPWMYDEAESFNPLLDLLERFEIPLVMAED